MARNGRRTTVGYARVDLIRIARRAPIGIKIVFVVLFAAFSAYFISGLVDDYKQHMLVRDHGTDTLATVTHKYISHGSRHNSYYFDYSFVAAQGSSPPNATSGDGAAKRYSGDSEDVRGSVFDAYDVGSKVRIRYATSDPGISFLHIDDYLDTKGFQTGEILDGFVFEAMSLLGAGILSLLAWAPWWFWARRKVDMAEQKERYLRHDRQVLESLTKYEPDLRQNRREDRS